MILEIVYAIVAGVVVELFFSPIRKVWRTIKEYSKAKQGMREFHSYKYFEEAHRTTQRLDQHFGSWATTRDTDEATKFQKIIRNAISGNREALANIWELHLSDKTAKQIMQLVNVVEQYVDSENVSKDAIKEVRKKTSNVRRRIKKELDVAC